MGIETGIEVAKKIFIDMTVFDIKYMISIPIIFIILLLITREPQKWKLLLLPSTIFTHLIGITPHFLIYIFASLLFAVELVSLETIGDVIKGRTKLQNIFKKKETMQSSYTKGQIKKDYISKAKTIGSKEWLNVTRAIEKARGKR